MFKVNEDLSIFVTRGDAGYISVSAKDDDGNLYSFQKGDIVRIKVYEKKNCKKVLLQKETVITTEAQKADIYLSCTDTKLGTLINKPTSYWYEIELISGESVQTIVGYTDSGPAIFTLFPEGGDKE